MNKDKSFLFLNAWRLLAADLSDPVSEYHFDTCLKRHHRFDWAFLYSHVAVEVDGGQWAPHGGRHGTDSDREKLNIAAALGWRVMRFSPGQLKRDPAGCVELVRRALVWKQ